MDLFEFIAKVFIIFIPIPLTLLFAYSKSQHIRKAMNKIWESLKNIYKK